MLILASQSPRRAQLLESAGIRFVVRPANVDESPLPDEIPEDFAQRIAEKKALAVNADGDDIVLAADTVVSIDGEALGKPVDDADAGRMLRLLSGRRHEVVTGVCLKRPGKLIREWASTQVWFAPLSENEISEYVATGEPMDKAGAYAIQGFASRWIDRIDGSYSNVVGLPIALVYRCLRQF